MGKMKKNNTKGARVKAAAKTVLSKDGSKTKKGSEKGSPNSEETEKLVRLFVEFVFKTLPIIYLASLIICFFVVRQEVQPHAQTRQLADLSTRVTSYYAILAGAIAVLGYLVFVTGKSKIFIVNIALQILLIWACVAFLNLFLTAFGYIWTYAVEQGGKRFLRPEQNLVSILFDTRLCRRPLTNSILGASSYLGPSKAGILRALADNIFDGYYTLIEGGLDTAASYLSGKNCTNTWGGSNKNLLFRPVKRDYSENFMGRLAWFLEDAALSDTDGFTETTLSCGLLRAVRYIQLFGGILLADDFFKLAINDSDLETNTAIRKPTQSDPFNTAYRFLKREGAICNKTDFANYLAYLKGENRLYELSVQKSMILQAMNKVDGAYEEYAERTSQSVGGANFALKSFDDDLFRNLGTKESQVRREFQRVREEEKRRDFRFLTAGAIYEYANEWAAIGFNPSLIFDAVESGQLDKNDPLPRDLALHFTGNRVSLGAITYPEDEEVQDAIARTIEEFSSYSGCEFGVSEYSCCDTRFRPFDENLGAIKRKKGQFYKIYPVRY